MFIVTWRCDHHPSCVLCSSRADATERRSLGLGKQTAWRCGSPTTASDASMADVVPASPCLHGVRASSAGSRAASSETLKFPFASVGGRRLLGAAYPVLPPAKE